MIAVGPQEAAQVDPRVCVRVARRRDLSLSVSTTVQALASYRSKVTWIASPLAMFTGEVALYVPVEPSVEASGNPDEPITVPRPRSRRFPVENQIQCHRVKDATFSKVVA